MLLTVEFTCLPMFFKDLLIFKRLVYQQSDGKYIEKVATIQVKIDKRRNLREIAFPRYTESAKFSSQSLKLALKQNPHRGLGTR